MIATVEDYNRWLERVTYRPGWSLEAYATPFEGPWLLIAADVPDAYHPDQTTALRIRTRIPPCHDRAQFYDFLVHRTAAIETHEAREWLRVGGRPWSDPHRDEGGIPA